jgi:hypothetical protein
MSNELTKLKALEREIKMRRSVYPRQVARGSMTQQEADHEIKIFEDIANDYRQILGKNLFTTDSPRSKNNPAG